MNFKVFLCKNHLRYRSRKHKKRIKTPSLLVYQSKIGCSKNIHFMKCCMFFTTMYVFQQKLYNNVCFFQLFISTLRSCRALSSKIVFWICKNSTRKRIQNMYFYEYFAFKCYILGVNTLFGNMRKSQSPCSALQKNMKKTKKSGKSKI